MRVAAGARQRMSTYARAADGPIYGVAGRRLRTADDGRCRADFRASRRPAAVCRRRRRISTMPGMAHAEWIINPGAIRALLRRTRSHSATADPTRTAQLESTQPTVLLVRHADAGTPRANGPNDHRRGLTATGRDSARQLIPVLLAFGPTEVVSSPYLRAVQTVTPTAQAAGMAMCTDRALREWDSGIPPTPDYARWYARSWARPETARPGGESLRQLSERAVPTLSRWAEEARGPVGVSHRTFIAFRIPGNPGAIAALHLFVAGEPRLVLGGKGPHSPDTESPASGGRSCGPCRCRRFTGWSSVWAVRRSSRAPGSEAGGNGSRPNRGRAAHTLSARPDMDQLGRPTS
ncbi:histidine phosphatase family protein [Nocardia cyriacigeorgica]|uniref:Histidine phosphatase family protein n=1 Tax=Nocardia cyriacigeorgica TaxID=135487 RepID=A0A5R8NPI2_9NOCA|nr:histidine phosphatase family protein [Nocardia cyriacigeorgica]